MQNVLFTVTVILIPNVAPLLLNTTAVLLLVLTIPAVVVKVSAIVVLDVAVRTTTRRITFHNANVSMTRDCSYDRSPIIGSRRRCGNNSSPKGIDCLVVSVTRLEKMEHNNNDQCNTTSVRQNSKLQ